MITALDALSSFKAFDSRGAITVPRNTLFHNCINLAFLVGLFVFKFY